MAHEMSAESWGLIAKALLLQVVATPTQRSAILHLLPSLQDPDLSNWERRRELLALLLTLDQLDTRPSGLLEVAMT